MTREEQIKKIYDFIHAEHACVLSTINSEGTPESATMGFSETEELKLIFQTPNDTRKYKNLQTNANVSIVTGWDLEKFITVQFEGVAHEASESEIEMCRKIHPAKNPQSAKYAYLPQNKFFIVDPKWIRYWSINENIKFELEF